MGRTFYIWTTVSSMNGSESNEALARDNLFWQNTLALTVCDKEMTYINTYLVKNAV